MKGKISPGTPEVQEIHSFRSKIMTWFDNHGRAYPWRKTGDPFKILIAEMMLRRTKAEQVEDVYNRFLNKYPDVNSLAQAEEQEMTAILYPLGLQWRIPAFKFVAREIRERYAGEVPNTREKLAMLPGVGDYVAGALLSIAYGREEWIVDSNVVRLFKRYFGVKTSKEGRRDKHIVNMAKIYAGGVDPRKANLALIDFSALVCKPRLPDCGNCLLKPDCRYLPKQ